MKHAGFGARVWAVFRDLFHKTRENKKTDSSLIWYLPFDQDLKVKYAI